MCNLYSILRNMTLPVRLSHVLLFSDPKTHNKFSLTIFNPNSRNNNFFNTTPLGIFLLFSQTPLLPSTSLMYPRSKTLYLVTFSHFASAIFYDIFHFNDFKSLSQEYTLCLFLIECKALRFIPPPFRHQFPPLSCLKFIMLLLSHSSVSPYLFPVKNFRYFHP